MRRKRSTSIAITIAFALGVLLIACSASPTANPANAQPGATMAEPKEPVIPASLPLRVVADVPLTGGTTRFDYQSIDTASGRLYIAHLGSDLMTVFDI